MAIKSYKPTTPTLRYKRTNTYEQVTTDKPYKPLLVKQSSTGGRNNNGRITLRFRGGGHKQKYRLVDFKMNKFGVVGTIETIEYDPNRTANIALVSYADGERRYVLATSKMEVGQKIVSNDKDVEAVEGNRMPLRDIPLGYTICMLEMREGKGAQMVRSAGAFATVMAKDGHLVQLKLPSGEIRNFREALKATVGMMSNPEHKDEVGGSAGRTRWKGRRPHVRGVVMNPVDHPMGGGEGKTSGGGHPVSPWGQKAKGLKTRRKKKSSDQYIVKRRKK
jgi:large subunit ribosomal protein L2